MFASVRKMVWTLLPVSAAAKKHKSASLFADPANVDPSVVFVNMKNLAYGRGMWRGQSTSNDPQIYLHHDQTRPLDSAADRFIEFSLFVSKPTQGQLIWWLTDGRWQTSSNILMQEGWNEYCFDMKTIPTQGKALGSDIGWEGSINRLRLDPAEMENVEIRIKDLRSMPKPQKRVTPITIGHFGEVEPDPVNLKANYEDCEKLPLVVESKPVLIYAEISTKCNLRCRMCGRYNYNIPASEQGFMKKEVFLKLSKLFTPGAQLALFGRGESLLHPDFTYFLEIARKAHMKVGFNTNGLMLTPEMARAMVEFKQTHITFSCSAGTPETYHKIHGANSWDKLWANIDMLNEAKRKYGLFFGKGDIRNVYPGIYIEFVSQLTNIRELPALLRRSFEHYAIGLLAIDMTAHSDKMEKERMNIPEHKELANKYYQEALGVHAEMVKSMGRGFDFRLPGSYSTVAKKFISEAEKQILSGIKERTGDATGFASEHFCVEPWRTFYVRFDGTVAPCVITGRKLGDLNTQSAAEVWNGEIFRKFRERMKGAQKPYECLHCHLFPGPKRYDVKLGDKATYESL